MDRAPEVLFRAEHGAGIVRAESAGEFLHPGKLPWSPGAGGDGGGTGRGISGSGARCRALPADEAGHGTRGSREEEGHGGFEQGLAPRGFRQEDARSGTLSGLRTGSGGDPGWGCGKVVLRQGSGERHWTGGEASPGCGRFLPIPAEARGGLFSEKSC